MSGIQADAGSLGAAAAIASTSDGHWERHAAALAPNVRVMRADVVAFAAEHGASLHAQAGIALAVSEALTNSVVHAFIRQPVGTIGIVAEAAADVLQVRVSDDGSGMCPRSDSPGMGLGLKLIARLTSSCEVAQGSAGRGTEMRLFFDAPGMRATLADTRAPDAI
jgi:anti-sigma regulatory factor (Ser/Thr protein kinase)